MRLKNRQAQTLSVALIMHANVRTPHFYRNVAKNTIPKEHRTVAKMKQKAADLIAKDLPKADAVLDSRLDRFIGAVSSASGVTQPEVDINWPKFIHDPAYQENVRANVNPKEDPLIDEAIDEAKRMRKEVVNLSKKLDKHFKEEHANVNKR